jgi:hypothetical protein
MSGDVKANGRATGAVALGLALFGFGEVASGQLINLNAGSFTSTPPPSAVAMPAPAAGDVLQFLDGAVMHGVLQGMEPGRGLRWQHPDAMKPFDLQPDHLDTLQFPHAQQMTNAPTCHFRFFCGDELYGSLVAMTESNLELNTWFGATLKIPRPAVQSISFLPKNYQVVYDGPSDALGWVTGGQQGQVIRGANGANIIIRGGGVMMMNGVVYGGGAGTTNWTYRAGSFVSSGIGTLGRDFHLNCSTSIDFDVAAAGQCNLLMEIYASSLDRIDFGNGAFIVDFDNNPNAVARGRGTIPNDLGNVLLPALLEEKHAHLTIHCNREEGSITVLVNGVVAKYFTDVAFSDSFGGGLFFSSQTMDTMKLSNIQISEWTGKHEPMLTGMPSAKGDEVSFINQDKAAGKIGNIGESKLVLTVAGRDLPIPLERVREINFAATNSSASVATGGPWDVRTIFAGGGSVSFQLEKWESAGVSGRSPLFGPVRFPADSIREMDFNLGRPKTAPAAMERNEFDALDQ